MGRRTGNPAARRPGAQRKLGVSGSGTGGWQVIVPLSLTAAVTDTVPATLRPFSYDLMASDVLAVMDTLHIDKAALVGWSDGACTALVLALKFPERAAGVFFFACNMDPSGTKEIEFTLHSAALLQPAREGLQGALLHTRPIRRVFLRQLA